MTGGSLTGVILAAAGRLRRWPRGLHLLHDHNGTTTVEFAMVGTIFMLWLVSLLTFGLHILAQATIDAATQAAGRQIQIGSIRGGSAEPVRSLVCTRLGTLASPCSGIQVYATSGISFAALNLATVTGKTLSPSSFDPGGPQSYVLLQVAYDSPFAVPLAGILDLTLVSTVAFKNEP